MRYSHCSFSFPVKTDLFFCGCHVISRIMQNLVKLLSFKMPIVYCGMLIHVNLQITNSTAFHICRCYLLSRPFYSHLRQARDYVVLWPNKCFSTRTTFCCWTPFRLLFAVPIADDDSSAFELFQGRLFRNHCSIPSTKG